MLGLRGEGRAVGTVLLRAKGKVTILGLAQWAEGDWYVSKAVHTWSDSAHARGREDEAEARLVRDEVHGDEVDVLPTDLNRHTGRYYGKYSGSVVDIADKDQLGRVKVSVPSVYGPDVQVWARPRFSPGHFFVPPVGAAVWVEFEAGDTGYPLWVGTWYPQGSVPPEADKPSAPGRVVHTPAGHVVELSDEDGKEKLVIRHKLDSFVSIDEKGSLLAANQNGSYLYLNADKAEVSVTSEQGHMVTLGSEGVVAVHSGGSRIEIGDGKVKLTGTSSVQIVAQEVSVAGGSLALGGSAQDPGGARERADGDVQRAHARDRGRPDRAADPAADPGAARLLALGEGAAMSRCTLPPLPSLPVPSLPLPLPSLPVPDLALPSLPALPDLPSPPPLPSLPVPSLPLPLPSLPVPDLALPSLPALPDLPSPPPLPSLPVPSLPLPLPSLPVPDLELPALPALPPCPLD